MYKWMLIFATILAIFLVGFAYIISSQGVQDSWSENCPDGKYYIEQNKSCGDLLSCNRTEDCNYLLIEKLPPRVGRCIENKCRVFCGSGIEKECFN